MNDSASSDASPASAPPAPASDAQASSGTSIVPGTVVAGRYRVESLLGEGAMGAVYLVEHVHMRKHYALKVLLAEARENPEIVTRFEREAIAAAHIDHPNVVAASDFGTSEDGFFFLVLEYIKGESLRELVERGPIPVERVLEIAIQIGAALTKAHGMGIVHRDLKPDNVMLVPREGEPDLVKVLDFGIAKVPSLGRGGKERALTVAGSIFGTPEYIAPEQAVGQAVDARADLYSFGIMLFEMLTGKRPFECDHVMGYLAAHVNAPVPPMREIAPHVEIPAAVEDAVRAMLQKVPEERPKDVKEAIAQLERAVGPRFDAAALGMAGITPSSLGVLAAPLSVGVVSSHGVISSQGVASSSVHHEDALARTMLPGHVQASPDGSLVLSRERERVRAWTVQIEGELRRLHDGLPKELRALPFALKAFLASVPLLVPLLLFVALLSHGARGTGLGKVAEPDETPIAEVPRVSDAQIARAETEGAEAVKALAVTFPEDGRVIRAEARAFRAEGRIAEALEVLAKLAKREPEAMSEAAPREIVAEAFDGEASIQAKAIALAESLEGTGADLLLACVAKPAKAKAKCVESLAKPSVREKATPAAKLVLELKEAVTCQSKLALLDRAKDDGDTRLLPGLKPLTYTSGCGFFGGSDCWKCLRRDKKVAEAIAAIEGRSGKKP